MGTRKRIIALAICLSCAIIGAVAAGVTYSAGSAEVDELSARAAALQSDIDMKKATSAAQTSTTASEARGYSASRVEKDSQSARELLSRMFTWDDFESYKDVRAMLENEYGVSPDDALLTDFFPLVEAWERNGVTGNDIDDNGLNMRFADAEVYLIGVGSRYDYFAKVTAEVASPGGHAVERTYGVFFKTEPGDDGITMPQGMVLRNH